MLARSKKEMARVRWNLVDLGSWESAHPVWTVHRDRIRLRFYDQQRRLLTFWISSVRPMPGGVRIFLSKPNHPIPEVFEVIWQKSTLPCSAHFTKLWDIVRYWLTQKFPAYQLTHVSRRADLAHALSGHFLRIFFRYRGNAYLVVAADMYAGDKAHSALSQALLWFSHLAAENRSKTIEMIHLLVPKESSALLYHRCQYLNMHRIKAVVWEYKEGYFDYPQVHRVVPPPLPLEERDFRWPVLGPFRWSSRLEQVMNLAPDCIQRYPRFQDYGSLRFLGLEFARVMGSQRDRICFRVGDRRIELTEQNFDNLRSLVETIRFYRRPDSPDTQHPYYRLQSERWLEALILEDISSLFPEMAPESVYSQIPAYIGKDAGRIDILGADRQGTLVVMELKIAADSDLPVQALDYWGRVVQHNVNGDFERRGYFSEIRLNRRPPKIYLISPIFSFHDSTELILRFLKPDLDVWKISINEDWRCGVRIMRRVHIRCGDLVW